MSSNLETNIIMRTEVSSKIIMSSKSDELVKDGKSSAKKRSWVEMAIDDDYEEEQERLKELYKKCKKIMEIRKFLFSIGEYHTEEGEIFE
jgi:hypothetical protein